MPSMREERALRLELEMGPFGAASKLARLAERVRVGLRVLRARVTPEAARFELELRGTPRGLDRARREIAAWA